jgi:hypothetical protein
MKMESFSKKMQESQCERGVDSRDSSITTQLVGRVMEYSAKCSTMKEVSVWMVDSA